MLLYPITSFGVSPKLLALLLAVILVVGAGFYHTVTVSRLEANLGREQAKTAQAQLREASLQSALDKAIEVNEKFDKTVVNQNAKILALQTAAAEREKAVASAVLEVQRIQKERDAKYGPIISGQPAITGDLCKSLEQRFGQYLNARLAEAGQ